MTIKKEDQAEKEKKVVGTEDDPKYGFTPERIRQFAREVHNEFGKVAWPDKKHTIASAGVVVFLVALLSLYLGAVDLVIGKLIRSILY